MRNAFPGPRRNMISRLVPHPRRGAPEVGGNIPCFGKPVAKGGHNAALGKSKKEHLLGSPDCGLCHHGRPVPLPFSRPNLLTFWDGQRLGRPVSLSPNSTQLRGERWGAGGCRGDALAEMPLVKPRAQVAFKNSMIRGILQFTLRIAFRCVLHRCKSQDIRC